jgi:hypothetical protein
MAFLDNSGDIILDAVLTDLGREKMATGDFSVSYFALGDDEIDYSLYNKNHASGSAYYDLEILQTPVLEAFTGTNAAINGGLLTSTATDILYMPILKINEKMNASNSSILTLDTYTTTGPGSMLWLTDYSNDGATGNPISAVLNGTTVKKLKFMDGQSTSKYLLIEDGLDTTDYKGTAANTTSLLSSNSLLNSRYYIHYDNRFIDSVYGADGSSTFSNTTVQAGEAHVVMTAASVSTYDLALANYSTVKIAAPTNTVYYSATNTTDDTDVSAISGPRGNFCAFTLTAKTDLGDKYSLFGSTLTVNGVETDYIDTTIYVEGTTTGATLQIPVRIIRTQIV